MLNRAKEVLHDRRIQNILIISIFVIYFIIGMFLVKDYGVSTDEPQERTSMYVNVNYILTQLGKESMDVPELETWKDKYYGMVLQFPMYIFEKLADELCETYVYRHFYTFGLCFAGYIFFFLLCKRLFKSNMISMAGTLMLMLYPRFFAEQFYNIKDMVFMSVFIVGMWATERLISSNFSAIWIVVFSAIAALTTNVRIVGIIFVLVIIGYLWCVKLIHTLTGKEIHGNLTYFRTIGISASIVVLFLAMFAASIPAAWKNPLEGIVNAFTTFSHFKWSGSIVFMGKVIEDVQIPWYYIPVWIMVSIPIWYMVLGIISTVLFGKKAIEEGKKGKLLELLIEYKYMVWALMLFVGPWFGMTLLESNLYNGWRHCYFMLPPIILFGLYGIDLVCKLSNKAAVWSGIIIILCLSSQISWIAKNHPYEMVYFNPVGRRYASGFDRDYWHLSEYQAWKYIAEHDDSEKISINSAGTKFFRLRLSEEELERVEFSDEPTYLIYTYRGKLGNDYQREGYEEYYSIEVDGYKIASVLKKKE